jgi:hypothetical protein
MKKSIILIVSLSLTALFLNCDTNKKDDKNKYLALLFISQPWAKSVTAGSYESGFSSITVGSDGIYAAGFITGTGSYTFGNQSVSGTFSGSNAVLVKYDLNGNAVWARSISSGADASGFSSVSVGSDGIYAAGSINGSGNYEFGDKWVTGTNAGGSNVVLVKYDTSGTALWAKTVAAGTDSSEFWSVSVGSDGIYAAGFIHNTLTYKFDTQSVTGLCNRYNAVLVKYDTSGTALWARTVANETVPDRSRFNSVAVGSDGIYVAGYIRGTGKYTFGSQPVQGTFSSGYNTVVVKYDTSGTALWAKSVSAGTNASYINSISVGSDGVYAAGYITGTGTYTFGDQSANGTYAGDYNTVLVKYDTSGNAVWAKSVAAGSNNSCINSVFAGSDGVYVAGFINTSGAYTFGDKSVSGTYAGGYNAVLVKYNTSGTALWAKSVTAGTNQSLFNSVAAGNEGIYVGGQIFGSTNYTFGTPNVMGTAATGNAVLVKYQ